MHRARATRTPHGRQPTEVKRREADSYTPHGRPPTEVKRREADIGDQQRPTRSSAPPNLLQWAGRGYAETPTTWREGTPRRRRSKRGFTPPAFFRRGGGTTTAGGAAPIGGEPTGPPQPKNAITRAATSLSWVVGDRVGLHKAWRGRPARGARRTEAAGG